MHFKITLLLCIVFSSQLPAQTVSRLTGKIVDQQSGLPAMHLALTLTADPDSTIQFQSATDTLGSFHISAIPNGSYHLAISGIGYVTRRMKLTLSGGSLDLGEIKISSNVIHTKEARVEGVQQRIEQKGDTTEYRAEGFKVTRDASAEDLVTKMPGITREGNVVKAQGEEIKKILLDGQEFFGDDARLALRSLPAEIVDRVQVFDRQSDQAQFTGFDDGNAQKSMNIISRSGKNNGQFGKVYAGYGTDNRYLGGGNINYFSGPRRIAVIGLANNINQLNFSQQDILSVLGSSSQPRWGGMGGGFGGRGRGPSYMQPDDQPNFLVGQQNGINDLASAGINYSDMWGKKVKASGSYFFNLTDNKTTSVIHRQYLIQDTSSTVYDESNDGNNLNHNHRVTAKIEYTADSLNSFVFTPRFSFQNNKAESFFQGTNSLNFITANLLRSGYDSETSGFNANGSLLWRHKFKKEGRTFSINIAYDRSLKEGDTYQVSEENNYVPAVSSARTDFYSQNNSVTESWAPVLNYTEPVGKKHQLQLSYNPSISISEVEKTTNQKDTVSDSYVHIDSSLSSIYGNRIMTQRGGITWRMKQEKYNLNAGFNVQNLELISDRTFPFNDEFTKSYAHLLPNAMLQYNFSRSKTLRFNYRTYAMAPTVTQLQPIIDNTNPLYLSSGNPQLQPQYNHFASGRFSATNAAKTATFFIMAGGSYSGSYIGNSLIYAAQDTVLPDGTVLNNGVQFTRPVNMEGYKSFRSFSTYGFPLSKIKSNFNLNAGYTWNLSPSLVNGATGETRNGTLTAGVVLSSNISEKLDFNVSYSVNDATVKYSLQPESDNRYLIHNAGFKFNVALYKGLRLSTESSWSGYDGLTQSFNENIFLINGALAYKFYKDELAEVKIGIFDALNSNKSVSRTVNEIYIEDKTSNVVSRFYMLTFTWNIRNFGTAPGKK